MSLRRYEYAVAIADEGTVTAAAARLRVAQPSVSQQLRALERDLGVALFARTPVGLRPTMAGRAFLREAEIALGAVRRARAVARSSSDAEAGELVVVAEAGLGMCQLPHAIGALRRAFPRLEVTVREVSGVEDVERLMRLGEADLVLATRPIDAGPVQVEIGRESLVLVLPPGHPGLEQETVEVASLRADPWVQLARESTVAQVIDQVRRDHALSGGVVARVTQLATAARLAAEGFGVTLLPGSSIPDGYVRLMRRTTLEITQPIVVSGRSEPGPVETMLLDVLSAQGWCARTAPPWASGAPTSPGSDDVSRRDRGPAASRR